MQLSRHTTHPDRHIPCGTDDWKEAHTPLDALRKPQPPTPTKRAEIIAEKQKATKAYTGQKRRAKPPRLDNGDWVRVKRPHRGHKMKPSLSASLRITKHVGPLPFNSRMVILGMHAG